METEPQEDIAGEIQAIFGESAIRTFRSIRGSVEDSTIVGEYLERAWEEAGRWHLFQETFFQALQKLDQDENPLKAAEEAIIIFLSNLVTLTLLTEEDIITSVQDELGTIDSDIDFITFVAIGELWTHKKIQAAVQELRLQMTSAEENSED